MIHHDTTFAPTIANCFFSSSSSTVATTMFSLLFLWLIRFFAAFMIAQACGVG